MSPLTCTTWTGMLLCQVKQGNWSFLGSEASSHKCCQHGLGSIKIGRLASQKYHNIERICLGDGRQASRPQAAGWARLKNSVRRGAEGGEAFELFPWRSPWTTQRIGSGSWWQLFSLEWDNLLVWQPDVPHTHGVGTCRTGNKLLVSEWWFRVH